MAADAFTEAFGATIRYEQVSYESYRDSLIESSMPDWQADGILEMFHMYDRQEPFCNTNTDELTKILGREPISLYDVAMAALEISQPQRYVFPNYFRS